MRSLSTLLLVPLALALGCGDAEPEAPAASSRSAERRPASDAAGGSPPPAGIAEGEFVVSVVGGRVRLASREASRLDVLRRLADLEAFTLDTTGLPERTVTLQLDEASLAAALAELLDDVSYRSAYRYDAALGRNRLHSLEVGEVRAARRAPGRWIPADPGASGIAPPPRVEGDPAELDAEQQRWLEALTSPNDRERLEATEEVDADGPGLARLLEVVREDPDPQVRAAALERLEDSGTYAAVQGMLAALGDRDARVVRAAISGLEYAGDETVIPHLRPLLDHADREVRAAAAEAIEFLE